MEIQNSSYEDTLAPRRPVKKHKSWKTQGTKAWENAAQKKSEDALFSSDSGSEQAAEKQPSHQQAQSARMYLRRGRSYFRERNLTGSESKGSRFGMYCAEDGVSAMQGHAGKNETLSQKHHQSVIQNEKQSTPYSTQSQVQKSIDSDYLFTPPDPTKACSRKVLKQKSKLVPPIADMSETEDSVFSMPQSKVTNKKNTQRQKKFPHKYDNYMITDAGDESPPSEPIREEKSKNSKSILNRTRQRESSGASERTKNGHALLVDKHPEQSKKADNPQPSMPDSADKTKPLVTSKTSRRNNKQQTAKLTEIEQDTLKGAWTDKELQKLNE